MFKTNFFGHNTIWGTQKVVVGKLPPNAPVATCLPRTVCFHATVSLILCNVKKQQIHESWI